MGKIRKPSGRESLEEFGVEGQGLETEATDQTLSMQQAASSTFPNENERLSLSPESDGPSSLLTATGEDLGDKHSQTLDQFKFLECDPLLPGEEPEPCPVCRENPFAYVPDWGLLDNGDTFFNGKNCTQNVVITVNSPVLNGDPGPNVETLNSQAFQEEYRRRGIRLLLDYFNKSDVATVYYYVQKENRPGRTAGRVVGGILGFASAGILPTVVGGLIGQGIGSGVTAGQIPQPKKGYDLESEERDVVEEILPYTDLAFKIPPQRNARTRILVSIPVEYLDRVPNRLLSQPTAKFQTDLEVTIAGRDFFPMARRFKRAMATFKNKYDRWTTLDGGKIIERNNAARDPYGNPDDTDEVYVNLRQEGERVLNFAKLIEQMIKDGSGLTFEDPATFRGNFSNQNLEKITFKFDLKDDGVQLEIKEIIVNKFGCPDIIFSETSQEEFKTGQLFVNNITDNKSLDSRLLFFIGALPDIDTDLQAREQPPWLEFVVKYLYPQVEVFYGSNPNTMLNDPNSLQCLANAALGPGLNPNTDFLTDILNSALDIGLNIPDAIVANFKNKSCMSTEELLAEYEKIDSGRDGKEYAEQYRKQLQRIKQIASSEKIAIQDPTFDIIIEEIQKAVSQNKRTNQLQAQKLGTAQAKAGEDLTKRKNRKQARKDKTNKITVEEVWQSILNRLGVCGFLDLILATADCVAKGLGEETATKALTDVAFNAMEDVHLERIFVGLPPEQQEAIFSNIRSELGSVPAPWDIGYINGPGITFAELNERKEQNKQERRADRELRQSDPEAFSEQREQDREARRDARQLERQSQIVPTPTGPSFGGIEIPGADLQFGSQSPGSGDALGTSLGNIQKQIVDSYRAALLDVLEVDQLLNELNKLPGAPIVAGLIASAKYNPCAVPLPLLSFSPRLDSFLNTIEADLCKWDGDITLPCLNPIGVNGELTFVEGLLNLARILGLAIYEALKQAALAMTMEILKRILDKILSVACDSIATLGANLLDLFSGSDHFRDLLKDNLCPDATDDQLLDALQAILAAASGPDATCLETLTNAEMSSFIDDISLMLTQGQVIQLLTGTASEETMRLALEVAATSDSECIREIFSNPDAFATFFPALGFFIPNLDELVEVLAPGAGSRNTFPCPDDIADILDDLRCDLLTEKGLSPQECRDQINDLKDEAIQDLQDLADILQNGPFANFPPLASGPGCPPDGFYPQIDPLVADLNASISETLFQKLEESHLRDLMRPINLVNGRGGVLNAVLADTRGRPWKHHNWLVGSFGSPNSQDLGLFEFYSNNAIREPYKGRAAPATDIYGNNLRGKDFGISLGGKSYGGYPPTVGAWMCKQLRDLNPSVKTQLSPEGFTSPSEARDAWRQADAINQDRIQLRINYLNAFFNEFEFDAGGPLAIKSPQKFATAKSEMLQAAKDKIFTGESLTDDPRAPDTSGKNRVWRVLNGKDISVAGQLVGGKKLSKWSTENRRAAGTNGQDFVDAFPVRAKLEEYPDVSSSDIQLNFRDFGDDPQQSEGSPPPNPLYSFELNYDYNLFDESGKLKRDNEYAVRVDVTYSSPSGKTLSRRQLRRNGDVEIPPSILDDPDYTYTKFEITSKGSVDQEVENYLVNLGTYGSPLQQLPTEATVLGALVPDLKASDTDVTDSYQIESMYKFFVRRFLQVSSDPEKVNQILDGDDLIRRYFSDQSNGAYDKVSTGFLKRVSQSIALGRSDIPLDRSNEDEDSGFLEPPEPDIDPVDSQNRREREKAAKIALNTISPAFQYGYDPYLEPVIEYLDPEKYGGLFARNLIKAGVDPERVPKPFYVQEQELGGWLDLAARLVPEVDGCEPARVPLYKLEDVSKRAAELCGKLTLDDRLKSDPLCAQEAPYDKILENGPASNIDGAIRAIARIYIVDIFIRATPAFIMFAMTEENYDDLLPAYVAQKIKAGLASDGRLFNGRASDTYYYRVIEQAYNTIRRKIASGLLNPETDLTEKERAARFVIEQEIQNFYDVFDGKEEALSSAAITSQNYMKRALSTPAAKTAIGLGYGSASFNKLRAKAAKDTAFREVMNRTEDQALVFLERYIREEFESLRQLYQDNIRSFVYDIDHLFLMSDAWVNGGVFGSGPFDVQSDPSNPETHNIKVGLPPSVQDRINELESVGPAGSPFATALKTVYEESNRNWPFVLERYIKIEDKLEPSADISGRSENLYNIVNIEDWDDFVRAKKAEGLSGDISKLWGEPSNNGQTTKIEDHVHTYEIDENGNGVTSAHIDISGAEHYHIIKDGVLERANLNSDDDGHRHEIEVTGWRFGLRLSYKFEDDQREVFEEIMNTISADKSLLDKSYILDSPEGPKYIIPIASAELPIPDQEFTLFDPESYDVYCLIKELIKTVEYKAWFRYMFPLSRFTSLMAIYISEGFFASLGTPGYPADGGDMWEVAGGKKSIGPTFRKWARGDDDVYDKTRDDARDIFTSLYDSAASIDFKEENNYNHRSRPDSVREALRPLLNFEDGLRWWQRGRRLKNRPFDQDGDECPDE